MITTIEQLLELYKVDSEEDLVWYSVSINQKLSEDFIEKYSDKYDVLC